MMGDALRQDSMRSGVSGAYDPTIVGGYAQRSPAMSSLNGVVCPVCYGEKFRLVWRNLPELRFGISDLFSIKRCVECDTHMTDPLLVQAYLAQLYERHYLPVEYVPPDRRAIAVQVEALRTGQTSLLKRWHGKPGRTKS